MEGEEFNVLIVEDSQGDARLMQSMLNRAGGRRFCAAVVSQMKDAVDLLKERPFDAVVLDLSLPDSKGMDTVQQAGMPAAARHAPVIVVTGLSDKKLGLEAIQNGAHDFLSKKGLQPAALVNSTTFAIERERARRTAEARELARRHDAEIESFEKFSGSESSPVTARAYGMEPLRETVHDAFNSLVDQYAVIIGEAIQERAFRIDRRASEGLRQLAQNLGFLRARPRDVIDVHVTAIKRELIGKKLRMASVMTEEARMLLVELMGYLAAYYREHMTAGAGRSEAQ